MARHRKTDAESALSAAMMAFWAHGFHTLGTRDLERETGITRFSLQSSYGGKKALFLQTLDLYLDMFEGVLAPAMNTGTLDGLADWFAARPVPAEMQDHLSNGCFLVNSIIEFSRDDAEINARGERYFDILRTNIRRTLTDLQKNGQIRPELDPRDYVEILVSFATALNINAKSAAANTNAAGQAAAMAALIRSWGNSVSGPT